MHPCHRKVNLFVYFQYGLSSSAPGNKIMYRFSHMGYLSYSMNHDRIHHNFLKQEDYGKKYFLLLFKYYTIIKKHEPNCRCVLVQFFFFICSNFQSFHEPCKGVSNHFLHQTFYNEAGVQG